MLGRFRAHHNATFAGSCNVSVPVAFDIVGTVRCRGGLGGGMAGTRRD
jgi:hypothetical protein